MMASMPLVGTPLVQFDASDHDVLDVPFQLVWAMALLANNSVSPKNENSRTPLKNDVIDGFILIDVVSLG